MNITQWAVNILPSPLAGIQNNRPVVQKRTHRFVARATADKLIRKEGDAPPLAATLAEDVCPNLRGQLPLLSLPSPCRLAETVVQSSAMAAHFSSSAARAKPRLLLPSRRRSVLPLSLRRMPSQRLLSRQPRKSVAAPRLRRSQPVQTRGLQRQSRRPRRTRHLFSSQRRAEPVVRLQKTSSQR
jgi:hypothetical protein